jgi:hypothetical protein
MKESICKTSVSIPRLNLKACHILQSEVKKTISSSRQKNQWNYKRLVNEISQEQQIYAPNDTSALKLLYPL